MVRKGGSRTRFGGAAVVVVRLPQAVIARYDRVASERCLPRADVVRGVLLDHARRLPAVPMGEVEGVA